MALTTLNEALRALRVGDGEDPVTRHAILVAEREEAIATIRMEMRDLGIEQTFDNDLHLSDIIEKHLVRELCRRLEDRDEIRERFDMFLAFAEDIAEGLRPNADLGEAIDQERKFLEGAEDEEA